MRIRKIATVNETTIIMPHADTVKIEFPVSPKYPPLTAINIGTVPSIKATEIYSHDIIRAGESLEKFMAMNTMDPTIPAKIRATARRGVASREVLHSPRKQPIDPQSVFSSHIAVPLFETMSCLCVELMHVELETTAETVPTLRSKATTKNAKTVFMLNTLLM